MHSPEPVDTVQRFMRSTQKMRSAAELLESDLTSRCSQRTRAEGTAVLRAVGPQSPLPIRDPRFVYIKRNLYRHLRHQGQHLVAAKERKDLMLKFYMY